jgi:flagellar hook-length control protein FliK
LDAAAKVFSASNNGGRQQVTLQLDPPELGQLRLQIRMHQDAMTLRVDANSQAVAKLIESRLPELRDALASHGIRVERSEVVVTRSASFDNQSQSQSDQQSSSSNQQPGHGQFNESRSSWAEGHRFGAPGQDGSSGRDERSHSAGPDEIDANVVSRSSIDGNESTSIAEYWLDLVA